MMRFIHHKGSVVKRPTIRHIEFRQETPPFPAWSASQTPLAKLAFVLCIPAMSSNLDSLCLALDHSPDNVPLLLVYAKACMDELQLPEARGAFLLALKA